MEVTTPSISVLTSLPLVCELKRGFGSLTLRSRRSGLRGQSSPVMAGSLSLRILLALAYWLMPRVSAVRKPVRWVPPSRVRDGVGEAEDLVVVGSRCIGTRTSAKTSSSVSCRRRRLRSRACREDDGLGVDQRSCFRRAGATNSLDAFLVEERVFLARTPGARRSRSMVRPGLRKASSRRRVARRSNLNSVVIDEDRRVREEGDQGAGALRIIELADDVQRLGGLAALEADDVDLAVRG